MSDESRRRIKQFRVDDKATSNVVIVVSEGLNALALMDEGNLLPLLEDLRQRLTKSGFSVAPAPLVVTSGRVRAGYRIGEDLYGGLPGSRTIIHLIGERPGSGHHTLSAYLTSAEGTTWGRPDEVDHNITKVVSGIGVTALAPQKAVGDITALITSR